MTIKIELYITFSQDCAWSCIFFLDVHLSETRSRKSVGHRFWAFLRLWQASWLRRYNQRNKSQPEEESCEICGKRLNFEESHVCLGHHKRESVGQHQHIKPMQPVWHCILLCCEFEGAFEKHNATFRRKIVSTHFIWNLCGRYMISDNVLREHI